MCKKHLKPIIVSDLKDLPKGSKIWKKVDVLESQRRELGEIRNPAGGLVSVKAVGKWIYFPWSGVATKMVSENDFWELRTNRNRNLITKDEQNEIKNFPVGVIGLSIGSAMATNLAQSGFNYLRLAENDILETTNLNRIRARVDQIGEEKIEIAARQIYEINPYQKLDIFCGGLREKNLQKFVSGKAAPKIIFEAIDNFEMKIKLRKVARQAGIPVIMFSNLGDSVLIDIERYDLDKRTPIFNGLLGNIPEEILKNPDVSSDDKNRYAVKLVGIENVPVRALESVKLIGKELVGRPQLMGTVVISGSLAIYYSRKIALGQELKGGRKLVKFDEIFS